MQTHKIVRRADAYRIEATAATGARWLLARVYPTEQAATVRLRALQAMAAASANDPPPRRPPPPHGPQPQA